MQSTDTIILDYDGISFQKVEMLSQMGSYWEPLTHHLKTSPNLPGTPDVGNAI